MKTKVVILGLTGSGKSTVAITLKNKDWHVIEVDEEVIKRNMGKWPDDEKIIDRLFAEVNEEVIKLDKVVFVTSFLEPADIANFHSSGFKIIEMHADFDELVRRKKKRDGISAKKLPRFRKNYHYYKKIIEQINKLVALSIDTTNLPIKEMVNNVEQELRK